MYNFDYFYGNEAEQYQFYMIPQLLFTDKKFKKISTDAKVLYSLLLDRTGLSFANKDRFTDDDGRTYIYFTRDNAMGMLGCSKDKSAAIFKELDEIGLIERKRQGLGKPDKIYVKHFNRIIEKTEDFQEVGNTDFQRSEKPTSGGRENRLPEGGKTAPNQTNISHTNFNQTQSVNLQKNSETSLLQKDGQTDGQNSESEKSNKQMPFSQVLDEIGFDTDEIDFVPISEKDLQELDEEDRKTSSCTLPYSLKANKRGMKEALKVLFAYSYYVPTLPDESKRLLDTVISALSTMAEKDIQEYQGQKIRYCDVIDRLNDVIHSTDGSLVDWFNSFEQKWEKILAENDIKHQKAYMKSCIWNWLNDYAFENDNDLRKLDYSLRNGVI